MVESLFKTMTDGTKQQLVLLGMKCGNLFFLQNIKKYILGRQPILARQKFPIGHNIKT